MIKKISWLALVICLLVAISVPVRAQGELEVLASSAQAEFPTRLSFSLSARSSASITDIRLHYAINRLSFAEVSSEVYIEFVPSTEISVDWTLEMVKIGGLPPGSSLEYWWVVKDDDGNRLETPPTGVQFTDNRYPWRSLTEGQVTIYWYEGDESFAGELMAAAHQALERLARDVGASLERPARIYIYAGSRDLAGALINPREWTGGAAFTRFGIIVIGISPGSLSWGKKAMTHELTHLVIHQITLNPYSGLPTWLDEGLAMYAEGLPGPDYTSLLHRAVTEDNLISVRSLASPFSAYAEPATLSYAESYSLVEFLIREYGQAKMLELLNTFRQGSTYDGALEKVFGFDMDGLNTQWRADVTEQFQPAAKKSGMHPALIAVIAALATALLLVFGMAAESWAWRRGW